MTALGLVLPLATRGHESAQFVQELVTEVQAADSAGFGLCLVPEHHAGPPASIVAPLTLSAALAAVTSRIRIGPGILILPPHHPRHVAEQVALIDQISGGRVFVGVGAGYQTEDLEPFGVPFAERRLRFEWALSELGALLGEGMDLAPAPLQRPRPPLWVGAWSPSGIRLAAALADGWIADPIRTVADISEMAARYRDACRSHSGTVVVMREAWVDDTSDARASFARVIGPVFDYYRRKGAADVPESFEELAADRFVIGSADECAEQVADVARRTGADVVALTIRHPDGPPHGVVLEAISALGVAWSRRSIGAPG